MSSVARHADVYVITPLGPTFKHFSASPSFPDRESENADGSQESWDSFIYVDAGQGLGFTLICRLLDAFLGILFFVAQRSSHEIYEI